MLLAKRYLNYTLTDDDVVKLGEGIEGALAVDAAGKIATT